MCRNRPRDKYLWLHDRGAYQWKQTIFIFEMLIKIVDTVDNLNHYVKPQYIFDKLQVNESKIVYALLDISSMITLMMPPACWWRAIGIIIANDWGFLTSRGWVSTLPRYRVNTGGRKPDIHERYLRVNINYALIYTSARTIDEYDVTIRVARVCVTSQINLHHSIVTSQYWI